MFEPTKALLLAKDIHVKFKFQRYFVVELSFCQESICDDIVFEVTGTLSNGHCNRNVLAKDYK